MLKFINSGPFGIDEEIKEWPLELLTEALELLEKKGGGYSMEISVNSISSWIFADQTRRACYSDSLLSLVSFKGGDHYSSQRDAGIALVKLSPFSIVVRELLEHTLHFLTEKLENFMSETKKSKSARRRDSWSGY